MSAQKTKQSDLSSLVESNHPYSFEKNAERYERLLSGYRSDDEIKQHLLKRMLNWHNNRQADMRDPLKLRNFELQWRIYARKRYGRAFFVILLIQNIFVIGIVSLAYQEGRLEDLSLVLSVFVSATLTETYFIFRIIVTQLFKEIKYTDYIDK